MKDSVTPSAARGPLRYLSVCSGIEAATVAWRPLGWKTVAFAEIEKFPSAVLAHYYPEVPNLGDITRFAEWPDADFDVLVGGTPCQSFSVAGLRAGLADPRGNLALTYLAIADRYRPEWIVWENVPGVLSSGRGRDFGTFLGALGKLGYGWAYRSLDAQYFGLAQRRKRVFVVGHLGDWRRAAAVLFDGESLSGNPPPRREAGQRPAPTIASRPTGGGGLGTDFDCDGGLIANTITSSYAKNRGAAGGKHSMPHNLISMALNAHAGRMDGESETFVTHALRADGFDAGEDGTGRGTPLVARAFTQNCRSEVREIGGDGSIVGALAANAGAQQQNYVAFISKDHGADAGDLSPTLRAMGHAGSHANAGGQVAVEFNNRQDPIHENNLSLPIQAKDNGNGLLTFSSVRRLTPRECERLQGFPDDYTLVPYRDKPAADGPRYKALGNSMAVPVVRWIGSRIKEVTLNVRGTE